MFNDYYAVLQTEPSASAEELRRAYKQQALRWHPDRHQHQDTTSQMQLVNEAYLILRDPDSRRRYDREYERFTAWRAAAKQPSRPTPDFGMPRRAESSEAQTQSNTYANYKVSDQELRDLMDKAIRRARTLGKQAVEDACVMLASAGKTAAKEVAATALFYGGFCVLLALLMFIKSCR